MLNIDQDERQRAHSCYQYCCLESENHRIPVGSLKTKRHLVVGQTRVRVSRILPTIRSRIHSSLVSLLLLFATNTTKAVEGQAMVRRSIPDKPGAPNRILKEAGGIDETSLRRCRLSMYTSDVNKDGYLDSNNDYIRFINRLSGSEYANVAFQNLPAGLQNNFVDYMDNAKGEISIEGAFPINNPGLTQEQEMHLTNLCTGTQNAIDSATKGTDSSTFPIAPTAPTEINTTITPASPLAGPFSPAPALIALSSTDAPVNILGNASNTTLLALSSAPTMATTRCFTGLRLMDRNRDGMMSGDEYSFFVRWASSRYGGKTFSALPQQFQQTFNNLAAGGDIDLFGVFPGEEPNSEQLQYLNRVCIETTNSMHLLDNPQTSPATMDPTPRPTLYQFSTCKARLAAADSNNDNEIDEAEYLRFVILLSRNNTLRATSVSTLPIQIQNNFYQLATNETGAIPIFGAYPAQTNASTAGQIEYLTEICTETSHAIEATLNPARNEPTQQIPTTSRTLSPTMKTAQYDFSNCKAKLVQSDTDKDNKLDATQYLRFILLLSRDIQFRVTTLKELPSSLQENFNRLASNTTGSIPIYGAASAETNATIQQIDFLNIICSQTSDAIEDAKKPRTFSPTSSSSTSLSSETITIGPATPNVFGSQSPTIRATLYEFDFCKSRLYMADTDKNDELTSDQYIQFVMFLSRNSAFKADSIFDLPILLQENFYNLAADGMKIGIYGVATTQTDATSEQIDFLKRVCTETSFAIEDAMRPPSSQPTLFSKKNISEAPEIKPTTTTTNVTVISNTSTASLGEISSNVTIHSSFVVSSVAKYITRPDRDVLNKAYSGLVNELVKKPLTIFTTHSDKRNMSVDSGSTATNNTSANGTRLLSSNYEDTSVTLDSRKNTSLVTADIKDVTLVAVLSLTPEDFIPIECQGYEKKTNRNCHAGFGQYIVSAIGSSFYIYNIYVNETQDMINKGRLQYYLEQNDNLTRLSIKGSYRTVILPTEIPNVGATGHNQDTDNKYDSEKIMNTAIITATVIVVVAALFGLSFYLYCTSAGKTHGTNPDVADEDEDDNEEGSSGYGGYVNQQNNNNDIFIDENKDSGSDLFMGGIVPSMEQGLNAKKSDSELGIENGDYNENGSSHGHGLRSGFGQNTIAQEEDQTGNEKDAFGFDVDNSSHVVTL